MLPFKSQKASQPVPFACLAESLKAFEESLGKDGIRAWRRLINGQYGGQRLWGLGPQTVKFFVRPDCYRDIPISQLNLEPGEFAEGYRYVPGEMPILFAYKESMRASIGEKSPLRRDGFVLVLEWRKGVGDSPLLSSAFHVWADLVRKQLGADDSWGLWPSARVYQDKVDFTDQALFPNADAENADHVASSYGALLAGLWCALKSERQSKNAWPGEWSYPTLRWNTETEAVDGVNGLGEKLSVAVDCGAQVVTVAQEQAGRAKKTLWDLRQGADGRRFGGLRICAVSGRGKPVETARRIVYVKSKIVRTRCAVAALLALLFLNIGVLFYWLDWQGEKIAYFVDYVDCYGVPQGIVELAQDQIAGRNRAYRFHYQGYDSFLPWKRRPVLREVFCVNSFGKVCNETSRMPLHPLTAGRRFHYRADGSLDCVAYLEIDGFVRAIYKYSKNACVVDIVRRGTDGRLGTQEALHRNEERSSKKRVDVLTRYRFVRDGDGHVKRISSYRDSHDIPVPDHSGVYRTDFELDGRGRVKHMKFFSWNGSPISSSDGFDEERFQYDLQGNVIGDCIFRDGQCKEKHICTFDEKGNCVTNRLNVIGKGEGEIRSTYDSAGEEVLREYFESDGRRSRIDKSRQVNKVKYENGLLSEIDQTCYDANGCRSERTFVRVDKCMRPIRRTRYDRDGELDKSRGEYADVSWRYDEAGRVCEESYWNADRQLQTNVFGVARTQTRYKEIGAKLEKCIEYFDVSGQPTINRHLGAKKVKLVYDEQGRVIERKLFDESDVPMLCKDGWHHIVYQYNRLGCLSEISYFGTNDRRVVATSMDHSDHYSVIVQPFKVASIAYETDESGLCRVVSCRDVNGKLMNCMTGWSQARCSYDIEGRIEDVKYIQADGRPGLSPSHEHFEYKGSDYRQLASLRRSYNRDGSFDEKHYDDKGNLTRSRRYEHDGSYHEFEYDKGWMVTKDAVFSSVGTPIADEDGVHATLYKRDKLGREIKKGFLNVEGKPTLNKERIAALSTKYDEQGAVCENVRFGVNGELIRDINGVCIVRWHFDEQHRDTGRTFYDENTNRVANADGVFEVRKSYDSAGNKTEEYDVGVDGRARPDSYGVCIAHCDFDNSGRGVRTMFYDADRCPVQSTEGVGGWLSEYADSTSHEMKHLFIGTDGKPCLNCEGFAGWEQEFDARGNVVKFMRIGLDGLPILDSEGIVGVVKQYDGRNRCVEKNILVLTESRFAPEECSMPISCARWMWSESNSHMRRTG